MPTLIPPLGSHFNVTDRLFEMRLFEKSHELYTHRLGKDGPEDPEVAVKTLMDELVKAQVALSNLTHHLMVGMYFDAPELRAVR